METKDFSVSTANNGEEAVDAAQPKPKLSSGDNRAFDIVLMDQKKPMFDGKDAAKAMCKLERDDEVQGIPILVVTADIRGQQQGGIMESGMDAVTSKSCEIEDVVSTASCFPYDATMQSNLIGRPSFAYKYSAVSACVLTVA